MEKMNLQLFAGEMNTQTTLQQGHPGEAADGLLSEADFRVCSCL